MLLCVSTSSSRHRKWQAATLVLAAIIVISGPILIAKGSDAPESGGVDARVIPRAIDDLSAGGDVVGDAEYSEFVENATGSQVSYLRISDGFTIGTATERFARPALSLSKLYIADYVAEWGTLDEQYLAFKMVSTSSDSAAKTLYDRYPESIDKTAQKYGLLSTRGAAQWGYSVTSTYDVVRFIAQLLEEDPTSPLLVAMASADSLAADGYPQDFGTSVLPGVIGSKWGWSDDQTLHSSVSFGADFVVAAAVAGTAEDLTHLVENQVGEVGDSS